MPRSCASTAFVCASSCTMRTLASSWRRRLSILEMSSRARWYLSSSAFCWNRAESSPPRCLCTSSFSFSSAVLRCSGVSVSYSSPRPSEVRCASNARPAPRLVVLDAPVWSASTKRVASVGRSGGDRGCDSHRRFAPDPAPVPSLPSLSAPKRGARPMTPPRTESVLWPVS